jgi:hypothetical protein
MPAYFAFAAAGIDLVLRRWPVPYAAELLRRENAGWLVTYNIDFPQSLNNSRWFKDTFRLRSSEVMGPGRTLNIWVRPGLSCPR